MTKDQIRMKIRILEAQQEQAMRQENDDRVYDLGCQITDLLQEIPED